MAYTTIDDPSAHFQTAIYTGNGSSGLAITNGGNSDLQSDLVWIKNRDSADDWHIVTDTSRGLTKNLFTNDSNVEVTHTGRVLSITSDGFTVGDDVNVNTNTEKYVAWQWKANGGTRTTNTESGNDPGGGYQANTTAGFSIVDYTGTGGAGTMAHGLGAVPKLIMVKNRTAATDWAVYHASNTAAPETDYLVLNENSATADSSDFWNDTAPTSTVFSLGTHDRVNDDSETLIAYLFAEKQGYSKFGGYTGNGNADGPFVYTGFKPAWLMVKKTNDAKGWHIHDNVRPSYNPSTNKVSADSTAAEATSSEYILDLLSNGFKLRSSDNEQNGSGETWVYMAFAEAPLVNSNGVPCNAR